MIPLSYSIRSLLRRPLTATVTVIGLSLVVFVFAAVLMLSRGVQQTLARNGSPDNALILRDGATSESVSAVTRDQERLLAALPEVSTGQNGKPSIAGELVLVGNLPLAGQNSRDGANVGLRGISEMSLAVHSAVHVVEGRLPQAGTSEVMIGKAVEGRYVGARLGDSIQLARRAWKVVGVFEAEGAGFESEIWADALQFMDAFNRLGYSVVVMRLKDASALTLLTTKLAADPQLSTLRVWREDKFYDAQSESLRRFVTALGTFVAIIFAIAAALGAAVTMYAQVAGRVREVGTLRAMGYRRSSVLWVFLREALCLGGLSGGLGVLLASLLSQVGFSTLNQQSFTVVTFHFAFAPPVAVAALFFSLAMGLVGGFLPAVGAARMTIVAAVRAR